MLESTPLTKFLYPFDFTLLVNYYLEGSKANVTVMTESDALTAEEVTRIRDALLSQCKGLTAQDITIVEVK